MVALSYLSERLGLPPSHFLDEQNTRLDAAEVDMRLAAGEWQAAADGYQALLNDRRRPGTRRGAARPGRGLVRLDRGREAVAPPPRPPVCSAPGPTSEEALSRYWLAYGLYLSDAEADARSMLLTLLERVRGGLKVEPEFEMRLLIAWPQSNRASPTTPSRWPTWKRHGMADDLDDRRRAMFLFNLAISYRETGDVEAAIGPAPRAWPCCVRPIVVRVGADRERPGHGLPRHRQRRPRQGAGR